MPREEEVIFEHFCNFLFEYHGWHFSVVAGTCDRCGAFANRTVRTSEPLVISLVMCDPCREWLEAEARKEYSGLIGLAGVYALAYRNAAYAEAVKSAQREAQPPNS